jgi:PAS domain S-box-containing protein
VTSRFPALAYVALTFGIAVSALSLYGLLRDVREEALVAQSSGRDDMVWYAAQYRFELAAVIDALQRYREGHVGTPTQEVQDRFDVLWSRLEGARHGTLGRVYLGLEGASGVVEDALETLRELESDVYSLRDAEGARVQAAIDRLRDLEPAFHGLLMSTLERRQHESVERAVRQTARTSRIGHLLVGVLVFSAALAALLVFERRKVERLRGDLERRFVRRTAQLRESEQRYRLLVENAPEAIVVHDVGRGALVDANANAEALFGFERAQILGRSPAELSPATQPDGRSSVEAARAYIEQALRGETPVFEWIHLAAGGREVPCEVRLVRMPAGDAIHVRGSLTDISGRRRTERELARHREQLEERVAERTRELVAAQRELVRNERLVAVGELIGTVSHELRNPLGTISASFATLRSRFQGEDERTERIFERIARNIARCDRIIHELLDYARMQDLSLESVDVDRWLRSVTDELEVPRGVSLRLSLQSGRRARLDPERLRQAVLNLLQNAFQSVVECDDGSASNEVHLIASAAPGWLEIRIADSGPGVAEDARERIFEPLFSTRSFGVGLGLPLVRRIAEQHGGGVELERGSGTVFVLRLPLDAGDD